MTDQRPTNFDNIDTLVDRIDPRFRPVWSGKLPNVQRSLARYFLPHKSKKATLCPTRPRVVKWYCPFAHQAAFPSGHRYCINVYTGCAHGCEYCYAASYEPLVPAVKRHFGRMLARDMADLDACDVSPAPVHLSNSTDPFQPLETEAGHTRMALEHILGRRHRFTTATVLTKDPKRIVDLGCTDLLRQLGRLNAEHPRRADFDSTDRPALVVEVSLAFWRDEARQVYDPGAPSVEDRKEGLFRLHEAGVPLVLRIDPLFPRALLANGVEYQTHDLVEPQTLEDLEQLVLLAKRLEVEHVVYSPAKIVQPRMRPLSPTMQAMRTVYQRIAAPARLLFRGGSWRLPPRLQSAVTSPLVDLCRRHDVRAKCCRQNLIETP